MVTLNHFTLPRWVAREGGWTSPRTPALFERYTRRVVEAMGDAVTWYCTINEPTTVATGGYLSGWGFPPGTVDLRGWRAAIAGLVEGHKRSLAAIHDVRPEARAGLAVFSIERSSNPGGRPANEYSQRWNEDVYLEAAADDDFIGVQTYTRHRFRMPRVMAPLTRAALAIRPLDRFTVPWIMRIKDISGRADAPAGTRITQMGWEYRPESVAAVVRRIAAVYPDKDLVVTEHGVATSDDAERVEFIARGLAALHQTIADGIRLRGYVHWSLMDNFEWATGYGANFGLVGVDRATQERIVRPSARFLGEIARTGRLAGECDPGGQVRSVGGSPPALAAAWPAALARGFRLPQSSAAPLGWNPAGGGFVHDPDGTRPAGSLDRPAAVVPNVAEDVAQRFRLAGAPRHDHDRRRLEHPRIDRYPIQMRADVSGGGDAHDPGAAGERGRVREARKDVAIVAHADEDHVEDRPVALPDGQGGGHLVGVAGGAPTIVPALG